MKQSIKSCKRLTFRPQAVQVNARKERKVVPAVAAAAAVEAAVSNGSNELIKSKNKIIIQGLKSHFQKLIVIDK